jgi:hypothetical protein
MTGDGIRGQFHTAQVLSLKGTASPRQVIYGVTHESRLMVGPIPFMFARAGSVTDLERSLS